ncbi:hypothetical protein SCHPADRAFT_454508 [Schizopora paradoxa]|uniref:DUF6533 domain-containing protein n=1 Tax=Schizopora paradoxa TaxID=27342 RepID=A0A0H2RJH8_9AGAM|nr:hypothetical protein SCHPADRAFT_454508 [Schizopora paradoxa]
MDDSYYMRMKFHIVGNCMSIAGFTILLYDQLLTFSDEVEYIWCPRGGPSKDKLFNKMGIILFLINRYFHPLAVTVDMRFCLLSSLRICSRFSWFEGVTYEVSIIIAGLVMILRVYALHGKSTMVAIVAGAVWCLQIGTYMFFLSGGEALSQQGISGGCSFIFRISLGMLDILAIVGTLIFDSTILLLVIFRPGTFKTLVQRLRGKPSASGYVEMDVTPMDVTHKSILQEGVIYYCVIFGINLSLTIMIATATPGIRNVLQFTSEIITATMISRITLHLRKVSYKPRPIAAVPLSFIGKTDGHGLP